MSTSTDSSNTEEAPNMLDNKTINLDILPLIQIIKHAQGSSPTNVSGQLLGMDDEGHVEVTYAYGMPSSEGDLQFVNKTEFQQSMITSLGQIGVDNDVVGWYTSTFMSSFCTLQMILSQYTYQEELGNNTFVLVIDSFDLSRGKLNIKAFRLTRAFMNLFRDKKININDLRDQAFDSTMIMEEVPLYLSLDEASQALLHQCGIISMFTEKATPAADPITSLEKNMEQLIENIDSVVNERHSYTMQVRQANKQKQQQNEWMNARVEENRIRSEMGDDMLPEMDEEDPVFAQVVGNDRVEPLVGYCAMLDFCNRLNSVGTNDDKVLEREL
ncbi:eukaryotic translation initiation factor 3 subunit H [Blastocystis sp. subtype 4]|uniref:eukaryotic translation initiation factor 3 subunit H n=1 Tax=Blastocystis sp. subtype 4 TaxID=944170 RepID=UPI0007120F13|nr:eukaryotic translation initiation factor 3 subunit H [Blastocystis sp. subtype 4]KNB41955.1 eukaryotic translation initiation factor 3 subunit H [Blastocystis sp. subtype 4]|eukprot:XP_014525398.1 eukaryotic translation initiation factor 3 subunit H [Blastocystis sp. subtype 4]